MPPQCRLWVRYDGMVLRQAVQFLGSTLVFQRMSVEKAGELATGIRSAQAAETSTP